MFFLLPSSVYSIGGVAELLDRRETHYSHVLEDNASCLVSTIGGRFCESTCTHSAKPCAFYRSPACLCALFVPAAGCVVYCDMVGRALGSRGASERRASVVQEYFL